MHLIGREVPMSDKDSTRTPTKPAGSAKAEPRNATKASSSSLKPAGKKRKDPEHSTQELLRRVEKCGVYLLHDQRGFPYARIPSADGKRIVPIRSEEFNRWLSLIAWKQMGWAPGREVLSSARRVLESKAIHDCPEHKLHVRVASHEDAIWVDLDGSKAVRIVSGSWKIVDDPPILFRSFPHQKPLPTPVERGKPQRILDFINLRNEADKRLFMAWLIVSMVPDIPIPVMILCGPAQSGKSTILTMARRLIDPCIPEYQGKLSRTKDFAQIASQNRLLIFDNESKISSAQSDVLCGAVTGQGEAKRVLYTDEDTLVTEYRNVIGLSGVRLVVTQSDLMSRSILFELEKIQGEGIRKDSDFWKELEEISAGILGGMFDILAAAMAVEKMVQLPWRSRLPDFTHWAVAVARTLGWNEHEFLHHYKRNVNRQHEAVLDSDTLARVIITWLKDWGEWKGTASELLDELSDKAKAMAIDTTAKRWPKTPHHLSGSLNYLTPCLEYAGVSIDRDRNSSGRILTIRKTVHQEGTTHRQCNLNHDTDHDAADTTSVIPEVASHGEHDADDANDTDSPTLSEGRDG